MGSTKDLVPTEAAGATAATPWTTVQPTSGLSRLSFREVIAFRDVFLLFAGRELKLRYKQTVLGVAWTLLQPLAAMAVFALVFGRLAGLPSDGIPYVPFVYAGFMLWTYLTGTVEAAGRSLVSRPRAPDEKLLPTCTRPGSPDRSRPRRPRPVASRARGPRGCLRHSVESCSSSGTALRCRHGSHRFCDWSPFRGTQRPVSRRQVCSSLPLATVALR